MCNGSVIDAVYKSVFAKFVKGCEVASSMEELENDESSLYAKECENTTSTINDYMKRLYHNCATSSCKTFHCSVQRLVKGSHLTSQKYLHGNLSEIYPCFNFLIFKLSKVSKATATGNFFVRHDDGHFADDNENYIIFFRSKYTNYLGKSEES